MPLLDSSSSSAQSNYHQFGQSIKMTIEHVSTLVAQLNSLVSKLSLPQRLILSFLQVLSYSNQVSQGVVLSEE